MAIFQFAALASSSKGNSALVSFDGMAYLIDLGLSEKDLQRKLACLGLSVCEIRGLFATHLHEDHLPERAFKFCLRNKIPLTLHERNYDAARARCPVVGELMMRGLLRPVGETFLKLGRWCVKGFELPHDSDGLCNGFSIFYSKRKLLTMATDLGHAPDALFDEFSRAQIVVIESNHDVEMLKQAPRPLHVKQRILSDRGHLSNEQCAAFLARLCRSWRPDMVLLAHLSQECNTPQLALTSARHGLRCSGWHDSIQLDYCRQCEPGPAVNIVCE